MQFENVRAILRTSQYQQESVQASYEVNHRSNFSDIFVAMQRLHRFSLPVHVNLRGPRQLRGIQVQAAMQTHKTSVPALVKVSSIQKKTGSYILQSMADLPSLFHQLYVHKHHPQV